MRQIQLKGGRIKNFNLPEGQDVLDTEESAYNSSIKKKIQRCIDIIVTRYEGPRGGPAIPREMLHHGNLWSRTKGEKDALITDGRFFLEQPEVSVLDHVGPEASEGGPIALIKKWRHSSDIKSERLKLISQEES